LKPVADALLASDQLEIRRGSRALIRDLSFGLEAGGMALIVGPNGAGKTSLLRVLAGLSPAARGSVAWRGTAVDRLMPEERAEITYRGHLDGLKKDLTVNENLDFYRVLAAERPRSDGLLDRLRLADVADRPIRFLSAGQRRRTALATLKVRNAKLWILDEPMTNLDREGRDLVADWIGTHLEEGGLAIIATHQPDELAKRGALMVEL
jgi:heme exporter protein A